MARQTAKANLSNIEDDYARSAFYIEKELGIEITPDYPALKFVEQINQLVKHSKMVEQKSKQKETLR